jgi:hypothetical protein
MDEFEVMGTWWLPENPDDKVYGMLSFSSSEGGKLELNSTFEEGKKIVDSTDSVKYEDIILGLANGFEFTCYKCRRIFSSHNDVYFIFKNYHFVNEDDLLFDKFLIDYSNIESWLDGVPIYFERTIKDKELTVSVSPPEDKIELYNSTDFSIFLKTDIGCNRERYSATVSQKSYFEIVAKNPMSFKDWIDGVLYNLQKLLTLSLDAHVFPISMKGMKNDYTRAIDFSEDKRRLVPIEVFYNTDFTHKEVYRSNVLCTYKNIQDNPNQFFRNWFNLCENVKPMINLFFANITTDKKIMEFQFLNNALALEIYHRRMFSNEDTHIDADIFAKIQSGMIEVIIANIGDNEKSKKIIDGLQYLNKYPLHKRILDVLKVLKDNDLIDWNRDKLKVFSYEVTGLRDMLIHYEKDKVDKLDYKILSTYLEEIRHIIRKCIYYELFKEP